MHQPATRTIWRAVYMCNRDPKKRTGQAFAGVPGLHSAVHLMSLDPYEEGRVLVGESCQGSYLPALHFGSVLDPPEENSEKIRICCVLVRENGHFGPKHVKIPENQAISPRFLPEFPGSFPKSFRNFYRLPPAYLRKMSIFPPFQKIQTKIRPLSRALF